MMQENQLDLSSDSQVGDLEITAACEESLAGACSKSSVERAAVVLLDPGLNTSRVVWSWSIRDLRTEPSTDRPDFVPDGPTKNGSTACLALPGQSRPLGAVLLRWESLASADITSRFEEIAQGLAARLDEILWLKRQDQSIRETQVIARINSRIDSGAVPTDVFGEFAAEIKKLVPYDRFTLFTVNRQDDLLTCVFRVTGQEEPGLPYPAYPLSASGFGLIAASCQGQLVDDLRDGSKPRWPELGDGSVLQSALLAALPWV